MFNQRLTNKQKLKRRHEGSSQEGVEQKSEIKDTPRKRLKTKHVTPGAPVKNVKLGRSSNRVYPKPSSPEKKPTEFSLDSLDSLNALQSLRLSPKKPRRHARRMLNMAKHSPLVDYKNKTLSNLSPSQKLLQFISQGEAKLVQAVIEHYNIYLNPIVLNLELGVCENTYLSHAYNERQLSIFKLLVKLGCKLSGDKQTKGKLLYEMLLAEDKKSNEFAEYMIVNQGVLFSNDNSYLQRLINFDEDSVLDLEIGIGQRSKYDALQDFIFYFIGRLYVCNADVKRFSNTLNFMFDLIPDVFEFADSHLLSRLLQQSALDSQFAQYFYDANRVAGDEYPGHLDMILSALDQTTAAMSDILSSEDSISSVDENRQPISPYYNNSGSSQFAEDSTSSSDENRQSMSPYYNNSVSSQFAEDSTSSEDEKRRSASPYDNSTDSAQPVKRRHTK